MTTGATGQLGLALPVQGELSGTWGDTVNNGLTQYINIAIAGTLTLTNDGAVTLANTTGDASASNVTSTLTGAGTVTAQFAIVRVTGTLTTAKVVTAPSYSKTYTVVNAATGGIVTFKASGQTGVSIAVGESAFVYFNGTDYVKVSGTASVTSFSAGTTGLTPSTSTTGAVTLAGTLAIANGGTGQTTANTALNALLPSQTGNANKYLQTDGTNSSWDAVSLSTADITGTLGTANGGTGLTSFTSGGVVYASSTSALATGSALTFDGTNFGIGLTPSANQGRIQANGSGNSWFKFYDSTAGWNFGTFYKANGSTALAYLGSGGGNAIAGASVDDFVVRAEGALVFTSGGSTEALRLTSTSLYTASGINVGIGLSGPTQKLTVSGGIASVAGISALTASSAFFDYNSGNGRFAAVSSTTGTAAPITFSQYSSNGSVGRDAVTIDSAGNLGLGVTPSAWDTALGTRALQLKGGSVLGYRDTNLILTQNAYFDGAFKYYASSIAAGYYDMGSGTHKWFIAPSGTAGNPISFTQAMTLDASGNLMVGTTTPIGKITVVGGGVHAQTAVATGAPDSYADGAGLMMSYTGGVGTIRAYSNTAGTGSTSITFTTAGTEAARITSAGALLVGVTSAYSPRFNSVSNTQPVDSGGQIFAGSNDTQAADKGGQVMMGGYYTGTTTAAFGGIAGKKENSTDTNFAGYLQFITSTNGTGNTEKARIDSSGNLLVGTTSAISKVTVQGASDVRVTVNESGSSVRTDLISQTTKGLVGTQSSHPFDIMTGGTGRARFDTSGNLFVGTTGQLNGANARLTLQAGAGGINSVLANGTTSASYVSQSFTSASTSWYHLIGQSGNGTSITTNNIFIYGNGNIVNTNNSYGAISDVKLKENIVDASPKLADLMQVKVRNYNLIGDTTKQLGVVAQELETVFPAMVDESPDKDAEGNDLGTTTKSVKYSVFVPMLVKAIQELKAEFDAYKASHP